MTIGCHDDDDDQYGGDGDGVCVVVVGGGKGVDSGGEFELCRLLM